MSVSEAYDLILQPRKADCLIGAEELQRGFLEALSQGKLHHAWLIGGPESCGKATFAYLAAKFLLSHQGHAAAVATGATRFSIAENSPAAAKISAGSHSDLLLFSRRWDQENKRMTAGIPVDDVRRLTHFFGSTAGEGGWRIVIVDKVDDMAPSAANALLKSLEEPPSNCLFFLLSDHPQRLLPTIRSRCRRAHMNALDHAQMSEVLNEHLDVFDVEAFEGISELAAGRVQYAIDLLQQDHSDLRHDMQARLEEGPNETRNLHALADSLSVRGRDALFDEFMERMRLFVHKRALLAASSGGKNPWVEVWDELGRQQVQTDTFNLDKKQLILNLFALLNKAKSAEVGLPT
ncbi:MAG: DNA polymerase III subunit delta' [Hyphomicrobiales bacterium]